MFRILKLNNIKKIKRRIININDNNLIIQETYNYFKNKYNYLFTEKKANRPYINNNIFLNQLTHLYNKNRYNSSQEFISKLLKLNENYSKKDKDWFPSKNKTKNELLIKKIQNKNGLYFGMLPEIWINHLENIPEYLVESKISQSLRQQVWMKYCNNQLEMKCICCNTNIINAFNFECGHIHAKALGGENSINNLVPICSLCNKSMGIQNLNKFMKKIK